MQNEYSGAFSNVVELDDLSKMNEIWLKNEIRRSVILKSVPLSINLSI